MLTENQTSLGRLVVVKTVITPGVVAEEQKWKIA